MSFLWEQKNDLIFFFLFVNILNVQYSFNENSFSKETTEFIPLYTVAKGIALLRLGLGTV